MRFADKVTLVTGAAAGLGRAYALGFASEGARVACADIDRAGARETASLIEADGGRALALETDVGDEDSVRAMVEEVAGALGGMDVLINNAGIAYGDVQTFLDLPAERWRRFLDVNLLGMLFCARACIPHMRARGGGVVLNQSSMASYGPVSAYSITKLAVNGLTVALAKHLAADGIRVNGIAPGLMASEAALTNVAPAFQAQIRASQLVRRRGEQEDVVSLALFLASDEASFICGQTVLCDGGMNFRTG